MRQSANLWHVAVVAIATIFGVLGVFFIFAPDAASEMFGVPAATDAARAYTRALGIRDVALCLILLAVLHISIRAVRAVLGLSSGIAAGDLLLLLFSTGLTNASLSLHALSGFSLLLLAAWPTRHDPSTANEKRNGG